MKTDNKIGRVVFSLTVSAEAMRGFADALRKTGYAIRSFADLELGDELWRANWWQRGEPEPGYTAQVSEPEWWQDGDEPPEFGMAA